MTQHRLNEPFTEFDSIDSRMKRIPGDLGDDIRDEYIENHKKWFLKNHEGEIDPFMREVSSKYPKQQSLFT